MPKMKTNSSAKKRFKVTGTGKVVATQADKRHNMRKRSRRQLREQRGTTVLNEVETKRALSFMPYAARG
jgi:large subunit ribosomal protein L35